MEIERISCSIPYEDFWSRFLVPGIPCLLGRHFTDDWSARHDWILDDYRPNLGYLREKFGSCSVPVADCSSKRCDSHEKISMTVADYLDLLSSEDDLTKQKFYLKDWHFTKDFREEIVYQTPEYFRSDWLNEFWEEELQSADNYKFVYIGGRGTWTPFHADVVRSYSWSANVCGRKKWVLVAPGEEAKLNADDQFDVTEDTLRSSGITNFFCVIQEPGEVIFVPSNWHHQVWNLDDVISINHNWFNASNVHRVFDALIREEKKVRSELETWEIGFDGEDEIVESSQRLLKSEFGMDYKDFIQLLTFVAEKRLGSAEDLHGVRDLRAIVEVVTRLLVLATEQSLANFVGARGLECFVQTISRHIEAGEHPRTKPEMSAGDGARVLVQYVIVRGDLVSALKWPLGAVIAQACHAVTAVNKIFENDPETHEYLAEMDRMHKVVLEEKDGESLKKLSEKLTEADVKHKLWIEQPEDIPTCIATRPYPKADVQSHFRKLKLFRGAS